MSDATLSSGFTAPEAPRPHMDAKPHALGMLIFFGVLLAGLGFTAYSVVSDIDHTGTAPLATGAFVLLGLALVIALGFEFVNGFHDTANAVATVIYTHSLPPMVAVVWSGTFNFLGVLTSTGAVAFSIVNLLPVELILQVGRRRRVCDDVRAVDRRHHLEPGDVGVRHPEQLLPRAGRVDHRGRRSQPAESRRPGRPRPGSTGARRCPWERRCCSARFAASSCPPCCCWRSRPS